MACSVCGLPEDGYHFKVLSCRACAAFFRRSVIKQAKYVCKFSNNCQLNKELRKNCPACRLRRCEEVGMLKEEVQLNRDKNGSLKKPRQPIFGQNSSSRYSVNRASGNASSSTLINTSNSSSSCPSPFEDHSYSSTRVSLLNRIQTCVQEYFKGERALHIMLHPEKMGGDVIVFEPSTHKQLVEMDRGSLSLIQQMLVQINPSLEFLMPDSKISLLRSFFSLFSPLRKCYLTSVVFPEHGDQRFAFHYGQYGSNDMGFFREDSDPEQSERLCSGIFSRAMSTVEKLRQLKMRENEFAALVGIILANEVDLLFKNDSMASFRDQIYQELHEDISYNYPPMDTANRFGSILCLLQDLQSVSREIEESIQMCKLFAPHSTELLWD